MPLKVLKAVIQKFLLRNKNMSASHRWTQIKHGCIIKAICENPPARRSSTSEDGCKSVANNQVIMKKLTQRNNKQEAIKCLTH